MAALGALLAAGPHRLPAGPEWTIEQVLSAPFAGDLTSSPDGRRLAWVTVESGRRTVWAAEAPEFRPRALARFPNDDGQEVSALAWSPDGRTLVFVRGEGPNAAGEFANRSSDPSGGEQAVWAVDFAGGAARRLGAGSAPAVSRAGLVVFVLDGQLWGAPISGEERPQRLLVARGRATSPAWSPDGASLAFVSERDDHSFIAIYRARTRAVAYVAPSVDRDSLPRWSPGGDWIAFVRRPARKSDPGPPLAEDPPAPWAIWLADAGGLAARPVWTSGTTRAGSLPEMAGDALVRWAGDGRLVFASEHEGWLRLYALALGGGPPVRLMSGDCEFEEASVTPDGRTIVYSSNCGDPDRRHLWRVPAAGGTAVALTHGSGVESSPVPVAGGVAFLRADARVPGSPHLLPDAGGEARPLGASLLPADFPAADLVAPTPVVFDSGDGHRLHGQVFAARGSPLARGPAVLYLHGGPVRQMLLGWHPRHYYHHGYAINQYLARRGLLVLALNYRGGTGYGRGFREAPGRGARGAAEYRDVVAAARYLGARADVDPERIGLWGGSYGGYLTALGLARNSDLFAAGVDLHGVHDWSARRLRPWLGAETADGLRKAWDASPVAAVEAWRSPVLLAHGDDDRNVDFGQTVDLVARLRERNVPFEQLVFPDEVHDLLLHRHWVEFGRRAAAFLERRLAAGAGVHLRPGRNR
jgi:dipeptidyl aminopeptidase/acylaminoacyl peptidase